MVLVKIFTRVNCPKCPAAKALAKELNVKTYNLDDADGLAEGTLYEVMSTPAVIVTDNNKEVMSWRGKTPLKDEVKKYLK